MIAATPPSSPPLECVACRQPVELTEAHWVNRRTGAVCGARAAFHRCCARTARVSRAEWDYRTP